MTLIYNFCFVSLTNGQGQKKKKKRKNQYISIRHFVQKMWGLASPICKSYTSVTNVTNVL